VVGAKKAGTTSFHDYLGLHPDVSMSRVKEPNHFADVYRGGYVGGPAGHPAQVKEPIYRISRRSAYLRLFTRGPATYRGESSTAYLWDPQAPGRIRSASPDARIIVLLRDPVERAFSHYLMDVGRGRQDAAFLDALRSDENVGDRARWGEANLYLQLGDYPRLVGRFVNEFGRDRVLVLDAARLQQAPAPTLQRVAGFLGISGEPWADGATLPRMQNPHASAKPAGRWLLGSPVAVRSARALLPQRFRVRLMQQLLAPGQKPPLEPAARRLLESRYADGVPAVERLLGHPVAWPWALRMAPP
jgi:hypothetical protein